MYPVRRQISRHAASLGEKRTDAENCFWQAVRNRRLDGFKFRFQHSLGPYVVDFACVEMTLIVEIDGAQHNDAADAARTTFLESQGFRVIRFWNNEVLQNLDGVIEMTRAALLARQS
ncbi:MULTISPECIES: endonuclease domain-containing protein [unclassified Sphingomonas]|uniref:endonuclease domain-containing protein n=1 Tax=unclassified Sphingomonas TaxID=196159 RepID=UPI0021511CA8|nr:MULTISPECIES: endonuclease domain-containing protein [unclassified Sphingomonas]MCR5871797.1 endonuclease domain-containing protein [Sphingomonas sp. J344]UUX99918.1 endonuclease domain-containing protein [Sphingomonas sp. J315]